MALSAAVWSWGEMADGGQSQAGVCAFASPSSHAGPGAIGGQAWVVSVRLLLNGTLTSNASVFTAQLSSPQTNLGGRWKLNLGRGVKRLPVIPNLRCRMGGGGPGRLGGRVEHWADV